jgi:hypothetical protein
VKTQRKPLETVRREGPLAARPRVGSQPKDHAPAVCPECGATYREGRWSWAAPVDGAIRRVCLACRRIDERRAGGYVTLAGPFLLAHRDEVLAVVRACEERQKTDHPLERVIAIEASGDDTVVTTTEPHLAHALALALHDAFKGEIRTTTGEGPLRASWRR